MRNSRLFSAILIAALAMLPGCSSAKSDSHEYTLQGQIQSVTADHKEATIKHEEIKGFMPAMTMPYKVQDAKEFDSVTAGDLITAKLVVESNDAYLKDVKKVGAAPLEKAPGENVPMASSGFELLKEGEPVPTTGFVDQDGKKRTFADFYNKAVVLTFIYTRCPMPTFCPMMDRNFVALQGRLKDDPALGVHLVTMTFDPATDTPKVLKAHAQKLAFDPKLWTFLTGDRDEIDQFASKFGVSIARAMSDQADITHNLRTAIIDRQGRLVKVYTGNEWTAADVMADIKVLVGVD